MMRPVQLSRLPDLRVLDGFLEEQERLHALERGADLDAIRSAGIPIHQDRTGLSFELPIDGDPVLEGIRSRIERILGYESGLGWTFRYRHYRVGEGHPGHLDCYEAEGLELLSTVLLTLVAPAAGGETVFPRAENGELRVRPEPGRFLCWFNHRPDGPPEPASFHEGAPVLEGEKITLAYFLYAPVGLAAHRPALP